MMNKKPLLILILFAMIMTTLTACTKNDPTTAPVDPATEAPTTIAPTTSAPTTVPEETPPVKETLSPEEAKKLKSAHPDAFGLDTTEGLKVLAFSGDQKSFYFRIISGDKEYYPIKDAAAASMYRALTVEEVKKVLVFYDLPDEKVTLHPWVDGLSSAYMVIDDTLLQNLKAAFDGRYEVGPEIKEDLDPEQKRFDRYVYPITVDSEDWFNYPVMEKVAMLRIDEATLKGMNAKELVFAVIDYPYLGNVGVYEDPVEAMSKECDALKELRERKIPDAMIFYGRQYIESMIAEGQLDDLSRARMMAFRDLANLTVEKDMPVYLDRIDITIPYPEEESTTN